LSGGFFATLVGMFFGIPSLRVKGLYLAVATLAAQFFCDWAFLRVGWFTNNTASGSVSVSNLQVLGWTINTPGEKYLFCLGFLVVFALLAKNLVRSAIGREWMAIRDMDVAAAVIGIRPMYAKLSAFAVSSFIVGVAGALWGFVHLGSWEPAAFSIDRSFQLLFMVIIGGMGSIMGSFLRRRLHRGAADLPEPVPALGGVAGGRDHLHGSRLAYRVHDLWRADRLVPDRGTAWPGQTVVHWQAEAAAVALPALTMRVIPDTPRRAVCVNFRFPCASPFFRRQPMKLRQLALAATVIAAGLSGRRHLQTGCLCPGQRAVLPRTGLPHRRLCAQRRALCQRLCRLPQAHQCPRRHQWREGPRLRNAKPATPPTAAWSATSA
jgi:hypothetical protein